MDRKRRKTKDVVLPPMKDIRTFFTKISAVKLDNTEITEDNRTDTAQNNERKNIIQNCANIVARAGPSSLHTAVPKTKILVENPDELPSTSKETGQNCDTVSRKGYCPAYKRVPMTRIAVDAFSYGSVDGVGDYFLTHFHSDHYRGLCRRWTQNVYCSSLTADLVHAQLGVPNKYLHRYHAAQPSGDSFAQVTIATPKVLLRCESNEIPASCSHLLIQFACDCVEVGDVCTYLPIGVQRTSDSARVAVPTGHKQHALAVACTTASCVAAFVLLVLYFTTASTQMKEKDE